MEHKLNLENVDYTNAKKIIATFNEEIWPTTYNDFINRNTLQDYLPSYSDIIDGHFMLPFDWRDYLKINVLKYYDKMKFIEQTKNYVETNFTFELIDIDISDLYEIIRCSNIMFPLEPDIIYKHFNYVDILSDIVAKANAYFREFYD